MKKRIAVLGASGFIGRAVVGNLSRRSGVEVVAVSRGAGRPGATRMNDPAATLVLNLSAPSAVGALQGFDAILNCAGGTPAEMRQFVDSLMSVAARLDSTPRIVHLSSMAVYGSAKGRVSEQAPPIADLGPYSEAKAYCEKALQTYSNSVILRPGCVFGPESTQWTLRIGRLLAAGRIGDLGERGDGRCNLTYVEDLAEAIGKCMLAAERPAPIFNVVMQDPPTWNEYFVAFGRALGAVPIRRISPRRLSVEATVLSYPLKAIEIAIDRLGLRKVQVPPPIPQSLVRLWGQDIVLDSSSIVNRLGMQWTPLETAVGKSAAWLKAVGAGM